MKRVLVLGAAGFVGRRVLTELIKNPNFVAIAGQRRASSAAGDSPETRAGDFTRPHELRRVMKGADQVVNCLGGGGEAMIAAAHALFASARELDIGRIVEISSMAVYGNAYGTVDEAVPVSSTTSAYAAAKIACEEIARSHARAGGDVVVLRPSCIYGPGSEQWTGRIGRLLQQRRIGDLGRGGDGFCNLIHIDDLAAAVVAALATPSARNEVINVSSPDVPNWNGYFSHFAREIGVAPLRRISGTRLALEARLLAPVLKIGKTLSSSCFGDSSMPEPISPSLVRLWRQEIRLDHHKADMLLRFPRTDLSTGLRSAAVWFTDVARTSYA